MERIVDLVGVQMDFGASKRGVSMGPAAIRYAGLSEGLERMGFQVENLGDIVPLLKGDTKPTLRNYEQVVDVNRRLYHTCLLYTSTGPSLRTGQEPEYAFSFQSLLLCFEVVPP